METDQSEQPQTVHISEEHQESVTQHSSSDDLPFVQLSENEDKIKKEPGLWKFKATEHINLVSDDENDDMFTSLRPSYQTGAKRLSKGNVGATRPISAQNSDMEQPDRASAPSRSIFDKETLHEKVVEKQRQFADKFREKLAAQEALRTASDVPSDDNDGGPILSHSRSGNGQGKKSRVKGAEELHFQKVKQAYLKKKAANTLSIEEDIAFLRAESAESARINKIQADLQYDNPSPDDNDEEDSLFVREAALPSYSALHSDGEDYELTKPTKRGRMRIAAGESEDERPRKRSKPMASNKKGSKVPGTKYTEDDLNEVLGQAKAQKGAKGRPKKDAAQRADTGRRKKSKPAPTITNLDSIRGSNIFEDSAAVADLPAQPGFDQEKGNRQLALSKLIASVPSESKDIASSDKKFLDAAIRDFTGTKAVYPMGGNWGVKGMRSALKHYQIMGTAFMRRRENAAEEPKGGILADEMGLGKTVMMLANIVNGLKGSKKPRATLIVASPALVNQWDQEIRTHCISHYENKQHGIGSVIQYRSGHRIIANNLHELLENADIVLTTYHEVMKSYPKAVVPPELVTAAQKDTWWRQYFERERGILHKIHWLRVVLDEAQAIKNHKSHTSMSCRALTAKHYWAITGTPIMNNSREFYSYLKFIREPNTGSFKIFCHNFCQPDDGGERLNVFLRKIMIRRTHIDRLFNAKLLDLPKNHEHTVWLEFSDIERQIYEIVKKRFIQRINRIAKQDGLEKQYSHIWTMILRLRQICGHVLLIQGTVADLLEREDFEKLNSLTVDEDANEEGEALLHHLRNILKIHKNVKTIEGGLGNGVLTESESLPTDVIGFDNMEEKTGGKHGLSFRFRKYLNSLLNSEHWEAITQRTLCCGCRQLPDEPQITTCWHIYCMACLKDMQHLAARRGHDHARCSECGEAYSSTQPCEGLDTFQNRATSTSTAGSKNTTRASPGKKKDCKMEDWLTVKGEVLPSAKTRAVKAQVMNWIEDEPDVKILIYSQFLDYLRILSKICETEGWTYCKYTGNMSHDSRDRAIQDFAENPAKRIMLASLKCGGLGLNLTMASRVICLDPWWNQAVENQAFARVYRIGQTSETKFLRLVVKNTIDAALMSIKERKQVEINQVMTGKDQLSVRDLMRLFGNVGEDGEGHPFIFAEGADRYDENDPDHLRLVDLDEQDEMQFMGNEA